MVVIQKQLISWLKKRRTLWWWVRELDKLSDEAILEGVMNFGDWDDFLQLKKWWGLDKINHIFTKMTTKKRVNLRKPVKILFSDYLSAYAH